MNKKNDFFAEETKKKYSSIFDKSSIKPNTQSFPLIANLFKCVPSNASMCSRQRREKFLMSRALTIDNILKILKLRPTERFHSRSQHLCKFIGTKEAFA